jgi:oxygen-independent coproporphyrinogen III oxidase
MKPEGFAPEATAVTAIEEALAGVPRAAYSVPHVYPSAAPAYTDAPEAERPAFTGDRLRLYMHLPYCRYRCSFCQFAVRVGASTDDMARYVRAVARELEWIPEGTPLRQLFVGGGTPTVLPPDLLDEVLSAAFTRTNRAGEGVHTIETSPETISEAHLDVFRRQSIGRVSMGVQTLDAGVLEAVHRDQTAADAIAACELLVDSGLVFNVDMIYGLPGQAPEGFLADLTLLADLGVPSLTLYNLHLTERTPVARILGDDRLDLAGLMAWRAFIADATTRLGYTQTRWHTFKRLDTNAARHDRLPTFDERQSGFQLGVGMSARSHLGHTVYRNHQVLDVYVDRVERGRSPVEHVFPLGETDRMTQFVARSLGDGTALSKAAYGAAFGRSIDDDFRAVLNRLRAADLIVDDEASIALTERGRLVYDLVTLAFYPPHAQAWLAARDERATFVTIGVTS